MTRDELFTALSSLGRPFRLLVTGGGTGGHTYPALTTIHTIQTMLAEQSIALDALWVGTRTGLESRIASAHGVPYQAVATGKLRRSSNPVKVLAPANVADMSRVPAGAVQAYGIVRRFRPDVVLSTGGYVAVPITLAAKACRRPLVIHEQTTRLGLANRVIARAATRIAVSSEATLPLLPDQARAAAVVTGNPVRPELFDGNTDNSIKTLDLTGFDPTLPTVYVTGGAQGSVQINTLVRDILPWLLTVANVIHQCGTTSLDETRDHAATLPAGLHAHYRPIDFIGPELPDILTLADLVISRSGAGTIAELTALGKPSILIPYPHSAGNEQQHNAHHLHTNDAAIALPGDQATPDNLHKALNEILTSPPRRITMAHNATALGCPDAAIQLATLVLHTGNIATRVH